MDRILRDSGGQQTLLNYNADAILSDVDGTNPPTVVVTDSAGVVVAGFSASRPSPGTYLLALPSNLEVLDVYDVAWTWPNGQSRSTDFELVGSFLFTIVELQTLDDVLAARPVEELVGIREEVETDFEQAARVSFTLRGRREFLDGDGTEELLLSHRRPHRLVSIAVDGVAFTTPELAAVELYGTRRIVNTGGAFGAGNRNVAVLYEHGYPSPPPRIRHVGLKYGRHLALRTAFDDADRATGVITEMGGYRLTVAGRDGPTGLPEVDAALERYGSAKLGIA